MHVKKSMDFNCSLLKPIYLISHRPPREPYSNLLMGCLCPTLEVGYIRKTGENTGVYTGSV